MALHRKMPALIALDPDIAVISECADPETLARRGLSDIGEDQILWMGKNRNKGLGIIAFNGYRLTPVVPHFPTLHYVLPAEIHGPEQCRLVAVWAQNLSGGVTRKHQLGPMRRALTKYRSHFSASPVIMGGDLNNNVFWDRPGYRVNHAKAVEQLAGHGLTSVYHARSGDVQGQEKIPTHFWRDRTRDGPTYHIDYVFAPDTHLQRIRSFAVGTFDDWVGNGLSDHVPLTLDIDLRAHGN